MALITELKRRNVFKVGIAYLISAWLLLQLTDILIDLLSLPEMVGKVTIAFLLLGFPVALFFAWAFELTPDGIKREHEVDRSASVAPTTGKKLNTMILAVMSLAIAYLLYDKFMTNTPGSDADVATAAVDMDAEQVEQQDTEQQLALGIAVLPFTNMSNDEENEFFAGGVHEEVLTNLSRIADLRVISRTSMLKIAQTDLDVRAIGARLGVSHVLEGSVRRSKDRVRVTVQLIDASTDEHLWAENYDRTLTDIFAIQSDIAVAIAGQLQTELSPETMAMIEEIPTKSAEAYNLYLQAVAERMVWRGAASFRDMIGPLEQAVAIDPEFIRAKVLLVEAYGRMYWTGEDPQGIYSAKALDLVTEIRDRWPDRIESRLALGQYYYTVKRDLPAALIEFQAVEKVLPNDPTTIAHIGACFKRLGRNQEHLRTAKHGIEINPESSSALQEYTFALRANNLPDEWEKIIEIGLLKFPDDVNWAIMEAQYKLLINGDIEGYLAQVDLENPDENFASDVAGVSWVLFGEGRIDEALARMKSEVERDYSWNTIDTTTQHALMLRMLGRDEEAQIVSERAMTFIKSQLESERPFPVDARASLYYSTAALAADVAGDAEMANTYMANAAAIPAPDVYDEMSVSFNQVILTARRGNTEDAWSSLQSLLNLTFYITPYYMATHPYYNQLFGDLPAYQKYIAPTH